MTRLPRSLFWLAAAALSMLTVLGLARSGLAHSQHELDPQSVLVQQRHGFIEENFRSIIREIEPGKRFRYHHTTQYWGTVPDWVSTTTIRYPAHVTPDLTGYPFPVQDTGTALIITRNDVVGSLQEIFFQVDAAIDLPPSLTQFDFQTTIKTVNPHGTEFQNTFDSPLLLKGAAKGVQLEYTSVAPSPANARVGETVHVTLIATATGTANKLTVTNKLPKKAKLVRGSVTNGGRAVGKAIKWQFTQTDKETVQFAYVVGKQPTGTLALTNEGDALAEFPTEDAKGDADHHFPFAGDLTREGFWSGTMRVSVAGKIRDGTTKALVAKLKDKTVVSDVALDATDSAAKSLLLHAQSISVPGRFVEPGRKSPVSIPPAGQGQTVQQLKDFYAAAFQLPNPSAGAKPKVAVLQLDITDITAVKGSAGVAKSGKKLTLKLTYSFVATVTEPGSPYVGQSVDGKITVQYAGGRDED